MLYRTQTYNTNIPATKTDNLPQFQLILIKGNKCLCHKYAWIPALFHYFLNYRRYWGQMLFKVIYRELWTVYGALYQMDILHYMWKAFWMVPYFNALKVLSLGHTNVSI